MRISAQTLQFVTDNLEGILKKNLTLDPTGEYAIIELPEANDAQARTFCDESNQWPGMVSACSYSVRMRDGCLGPGEQDANGKCQPDLNKPRESRKSTIRVRIADLARKIKIEMEDPGNFSQGGFRLILEDLSVDADITLFTKFPPIFGFQLGQFTCRYRSPESAGGQALNIEKIDVSIQPRIDEVDGKPVMFATSVVRDLRLASLALTAETVPDPACATADCTSTCDLMAGAIGAVGTGFNFINDLLKPALPYIVTPIANAALAFLWGDALEFSIDIPVQDFSFIPKAAGRNVRLLASAHPGSFAVTQKGSGLDDPTRGTGLDLALGAHADLSPCVETTFGPPGYFSTGAQPILDGTIEMQDPTNNAGVMYEEPYNLGLTISEGFFNQIAYALRNSGMLCIALGSDPGGLLATGNFVPNAGLLYLIAPPLASMAPANAPIFFRMRPGKPPTVKLGSGKLTGKDDKGKPVREPLLTLSLLDMGVEFHLYSQGRYIRTFALNVDIAVGLTVYPTTDGKLMMSIDSIKADNIVEVFNELMPKYDFSGISEVLFSILSTQLASSSLAFELPIKDALKNVLGDSMTVKLLDVRAESNREHLGIYVKLCTAADEADPNNKGCFGVVSPTREVSQIAAAVTGADYGSATFHVTAPADGEWEYQAAVDSQTYGAFYSPDENGNVRIESPMLRMMGHHRVTLRPRPAGRPVDLNAVTVEVPVLVDPESPRVTIEGYGGLRTITGEDYVTPADKLMFSVVDGENETPFVSLTEATTALRAASDDAFALARDEAGNISADPRLLATWDRGPAREAQGCAQTDASPLLLIAAALLLRRRR